MNKKKNEFDFLGMFGFKFKEKKECIAFTNVFFHTSIFMCRCLCVLNFLQKYHQKIKKIWKMVLFLI